MNAPPARLQQAVSPSASRTGRLNELPCTWRALGLVAVAMLGGCALADAGAPPGEIRVADVSDAPAAGEIGRSDDLVLVRPTNDETLDALAKRVLGDQRHWWWIADANGLRRREQLSDDMVLRVPLHDGVLRDVWPTGFQVVPVLSWHRFDGSGARLSVSGPEFAEQLNYLVDHDYRVVSLAALERWLRNDVPLPRRAVVLTIDDGHRSVHRTAWPLLSDFGFAATLFVYTDYVGRGGVSWRELREMHASGHMSVHSHSKSHEDLVRLHAERPEALDDEFAVPRQRIGQRLGAPRPAYVAYPYGSANRSVATAARQQGHRLGLTVHPGGNTFYTRHMLLRRTMVFSDRGMAGFIDGLETWRALPGSAVAGPSSDAPAGPPRDLLRAAPGSVLAALREQAARAEHSGDVAAAIGAWQQLEALAMGRAGAVVAPARVPLWSRLSERLGDGIAAVTGGSTPVAEGVRRDAGAVAAARAAQARLRGLVAERSESALAGALAARREGRHGHARELAVAALAADPHHVGLRGFLRR